eukprot:GHVT01015732.1.p1 GENE.GHVT01015732.1~~GHVT01015732.1.p1  ORF type:complete len:223 (+),score=39.88 GHVT01015732.1:5012-5680(+)
MLGYHSIWLDETGVCFRDELVPLSKSVFASPSRISAQSQSLVPFLLVYGFSRLRCSSCGACSSCGPVPPPPCCCPLYSFPPVVDVRIVEPPGQRKGRTDSQTHKIRITFVSQASPPPPNHSSTAPCFRVTPYGAPHAPPTSSFSPCASSLFFLVSFSCCPSPTLRWSNWPVVLSRFRRCNFFQLRGRLFPPPAPFLRYSNVPLLRAGRGPRASPSQRAAIEV